MSPANNSRPRTVSELFPSRFLSAADLAGRIVTVTIARVELEELRQQNGSKELKAIVYFVKANKGLVLNKTQARSIAEIAGTEEFEKWHGMVIRLQPAHAPNGRDTIAVTAAPAPPPAAPPPPPPPAAADTAQPPAQPVAPPPSLVETPEERAERLRQEEEEARADREFHSWQSASKTITARRPAPGNGR